MSTSNDIQPAGPILMFEAVGYTLHFGSLLSCARMAEDGSLEKWAADQLNWVEVADFSLEPDVQVQIDAAFTALLSMDSESTLYDEYKLWCESEGLPHISADEHDAESLSMDQGRYLRDFEARWDRALDPENAVCGRLSHAAWLRGTIVASDLKGAAGGIKPVV